MADTTTAPQAPADQVTNAYLQNFRRTPGAEEVSYWTNLMGSASPGFDLNQAIVGGASGADKTFYDANKSFVQQTGTPGVDQWIENAYQNNFLRAPDAGGMDYWRNLINSTPEQETAAQIASMIAKNASGIDPLVYKASRAPGGSGAWGGDYGDGRPPVAGMVYTPGVGWGYPGVGMGKTPTQTANNGWGLFAPPSGYRWNAVGQQSQVQQAAPPAWLQAIMQSIAGGSTMNPFVVGGGSSMYPPGNVTPLGAGPAY